jgi:hypothetical protein
VSVSTGGSAYEIWVATLRSWAEDPRTGLDHLPMLDERSFSPDTYARLMRHLIESVEAAARRGVQALERAFQHSTTPAELEAALVAVRPVLARRAVLVRHPALPEPVRCTLEDAMRRELTRAQDDIEGDLRRRAARGRVDSDHTDRMLAVVRRNRLTSALDRTYADADGRLEVAPLPIIASDDRPTRRVRPRRMVSTPPTDD